MSQGLFPQLADQMPNYPTSSPDSFLKSTRPDTRLPKSRAGGQGPCGQAGAVFEVTRPFGQER